MPPTPLALGVRLDISCIGTASTCQLGDLDGEKKHFVVIARFRGDSDEWKKLQTIPLVLENGHYFGMRRNPRSQYWPKEWMDDSVPSSQDYHTVEVNKVLRGGGACQNSLITPKRMIG